MNNPKRMIRRTIDTAEKAAIWNDAIATAIDMLEPLEATLRKLFIDGTKFPLERRIKEEP